MPPPTIEESARRAGAWAWAEGRLYEVVGGWCPSSLDPAVKIFFSSASQHHAWRAQLWRERLPGRLVPAFPAPPGGLPPAAPGPAPTPAEALVRPWSAGVEAALGALAGVDTDGGRLGAYCRVILPHAVVTYRSWQRRCAPSADQPVVRALGLALGDVMADWQQGAEVFTALVGQSGGADHLEEAAAASLRLERLLVGWPALAPGAAAGVSAPPAMAGPDA